MKTGTIIAIVVGVIGAATGGYILHRRKQSNNVLMQAQQQGTVAVPQQSISPYEGTVFIVGGKHIHLVKNGVLRYVPTFDLLIREVGTKDLNLLRSSGVAKDVAALPPDIQAGTTLSGLRLLR